MILLTGATGTSDKRCCRSCSRPARRYACWSATPASSGGCGSRCDRARRSGRARRTRTWSARRYAASTRSSTWPRRSATSRRAPVEELNGLATARLLRGPPSERRRRFVLLLRDRRDRVSAHALLSRQGARGAAVMTRRCRRHGLRPVDRLRPRRPLDDALRRLSCLPAYRSPARARPATSRSGPATSRAAWLRTSPRRQARGDELAGPERLTYDRCRTWSPRRRRRDRPLVHVPLRLVRYGARRPAPGSRRRGVRHLGGGRVDGGLDGQQARRRRCPGPRRRAAKDERCTGEPEIGRRDGRRWQGRARVWCAWSAGCVAWRWRDLLRSSRRGARGRFRRGGLGDAGKRRARR